MDRSLVAFWFGAAALVVPGCSHAPRGPAAGGAEAIGTTKAARKTGSAVDSKAERYSWAPSTLSPQPLDLDGGANLPCGRSDVALLRVAERVAE
ncbi:MAG TPA: hypothetical protein VF103_03970, partial [Polyangiaceae bacterium]